MNPKKFTLKYQHSHINYHSLPVTPFKEFNDISLLENKIFKKCKILTNLINPLTTFIFVGGVGW